MEQEWVGGKRKIWGAQDEAETMMRAVEVGTELER
jgi:hypothetical protein